MKMSQTNGERRNWALALAWQVFCGYGCGQSVILPATDRTSCGEANQAQIMVGEGYFAHLCGCMGSGEVAGVVVPPSQVLTCHLARADTQVVFYFGMTQGPHQIVSDGVPGLTATQWVPAKSEVPVSFPVYLGQHGAVYRFRDATTGVKGQLIVP